MEVKEFVKTILTEVTEAVDESTNEKHRFHIPEEASDGIDFDLAVVLKQGTEGKMGAEIFNIGGKVQGSISKEAINRIKFRVRTWERSK